MSEFVVPEGAGEVPEFQPASSTTTAVRRPCVQTVNRFGLVMSIPCDEDMWRVYHGEADEVCAESDELKSGCLHHEYLPAGGEA